MVLAEVRLEHKTISGPVEQTIDSFLKDAPQGSELIITGQNSAEEIEVVDFPNVRALEKAGVEKAKKIGREVVHAIEITSSPVVRTFRRAPKPT